MASILTALACSADAFQAAPEGSPYVGYRLGAALHSPSLSSSELTSLDRTVFAQGIYAGYQFNTPWGAEFFWSDSGNYKVISRTTGNTVGLVETDVYGAGALYRLYQQASFDAFATGGAARVQQDVQHADTKVDDATHLYLGAGLRWAPLPRLQLRAEYSYYASELQIASIALAWHFSDGPTQNTASEPIRAPETLTMSCDQLSVVYEGVKFEHGSVALTELARKELDQLAAQLRRLPEDVDFEIRAHSDSSGSESFNYSLSVVRARAIREYLGDHGIALSRIRAEGYGEWNMSSDSNPQTSPNSQRRADLVLLGTESYQATPCGDLVIPPSSRHRHVSK